jgi:short-subunit dehydrogenase
MAYFTQVDPQKFGAWAIVTGASSGIGAEFARQLAQSGLNLVLVARREHLLQSLGEALQSKHGIQYRVVGADLRTDDFMKDIIAATADLDIGLLISNAGAGNPGAFLCAEQAELMDIVRLNVRSHLAMVHHFGKRLAKRGRGGIVLVSAMGAADGLPYMSNDAATKAYILSLGKGLHSEFAPLGIHVSVLQPGPTDTPVIEQFGFDPAVMPVKPMSVEQCVAEGLTALNTNKASHLTGRMNRWMDFLVPARIKRRMLGKMIASGAEKKTTQPVSGVAL